jgi:hypothetical protein
MTVTPGKRRPRLGVRFGRAPVGPDPVRRQRPMLGEMAVLSGATISVMQRRLGRGKVNSRTRPDYLRDWHWLRLEALRGYASAGDSRRYAENMRRCAGLVLKHGNGTFLELQARAGVKNPGAGR